MAEVKSDQFRVGLVQSRCSVDRAENLEKALAGVREAARRGARIVCLQELFASEYFCREMSAELFALAEAVPGPTTAAVGRVAKECGVAVVASVFERRDAGVYHNTAAVIGGDGELTGIYRKMHIPDDPLYYEKFYFTPGDLGWRVFDVGFARIGVLVCWDQWYPEAARLTAMEGAEILFYPTAIGWHPSEKAVHGAGQLDAWRTVQRGHAIANGVYVAAVNRTGYEGTPEQGLEFWGNSFVADPFGALAAEAPTGEEAVLVVECDRRRMEEVRRNWPFFRDRRVDSFGGLTRRWGGPGQS